MSLAALLRDLGITLANVGFMKLNILFPIMLGASHITLTTWCSSSLADDVVGMLPVPIAKIPFFVMAVLPIIAILCAVIVVMALSALAPNGYESQKSRAQKAAGALAAKGLPAWLDRVQAAQVMNSPSPRQDTVALATSSADYNMPRVWADSLFCSSLNRQYNTFEACICMLCSFYVASELLLPQALFAKMSTLFLICRLTFPLFYAFDLDFFRTMSWLMGLYTVIMIAFAALFPEAMLPLFGETLVVKKR